MKKLLALFVAMAMLAVLPASALAEESTVYRLSIYDPILYVDDQAVLDMTGLNVDLLAGVTDSGVLSLMTELYTGEDVDYATGLYAQLDPAGLTFSMGGMANNYRVDLTPYLGFNPCDLLSAFSPRTVMLSLPELVSGMGFELTAADRMNLVGDLFGSFVTDTATEGNTSTHTFEIDRATGEALISQITSAVEQTTGYPEATLTGFDLSGTIVATGNPENGEASVSVDATGNLYYAIDGETVAPFTLTYADDMATITGALTLESEAGSAVIGIEGAFDTTDDGRDSSDVVVTLEDSVSGTTQMRFAAEPDAASDRVDYTFEALSSDEEVNLRAVLSTDSDPDFAESFELTLEVESSEESLFFSTGYAGDVYNDGDEFGDYRGGTFYININDGVTDIYLDMILGLFTEDFRDSAEWMLDYESAIDVETMTENDITLAVMSAVGVLGNVSSMIMEDVPGLAPYVEGILSEIISGVEELPATFQAL